MRLHTLIAEVPFRTPQILTVARLVCPPAFMSVTHSRRSFRYTLRQRGGHPGDPRGHSARTGRSSRSERRDVCSGSGGKGGVMAWHARRTPREHATGCQAPVLPLLWPLLKALCCTGNRSRTAVPNTARDTSDASRARSRTQTRQSRLDLPWRAPHPSQWISSLGAANQSADRGISAPMYTFVTTAPLHRQGRGVHTVGMPQLTRFICADSS